MTTKKKADKSAPESTSISAFKGFDIDCLQWLPVVGYEFLYEVSSTGRVRSIQRETVCGLLGGKELSPETCRNGYRRVTLSRFGVAKRFLVHRLVLTAFSGIPNARQQARHLNGDRRDNRFVNLTWGSASDNAYDRVIHGTQFNNRGERHGMTHLTDKNATEILRLKSLGIPQRTLARQFQIGEATVSRIVNGLGWKHLDRSAA